MQIFKDFPVTEEEFGILEKKFGKLCEHAAWELLKKNSRNNHTDDQVDFSQELKMALVVAASYYKRQVYIESCLTACEEYVEDKFLVKIVQELRNLWDNKTKHGANRQKFGPYQEELLETLVVEFVPLENRPDKTAGLRMDVKFITYCKAITWNRQKAMGKKISKEKIIRQGQVSLSEFEYLGGY